MESIGNLLGQHSVPEEPAEIRLIKRYIQEQFKAPSKIAINDTAIIITVTSASLATMLRLRTIELRAACNTTKRLAFRIGPIDVV